MWLMCLLLSLVVVVGGVFVESVFVMWVMRLELSVIFDVG